MSSPPNRFPKEWMKKQEKYANPYHSFFAILIVQYLFLFLSETGSPGRPGWPQSPSVAEDDPEPLTLLVLGSQMWVDTPSFMPCCGSTRSLCLLSKHSTYCAIFPKPQICFYTLISQRQAIRHFTTVKAQIKFYNILKHYQLTDNRISSADTENLQCPSNYEWSWW